MKTISNSFLVAFAVAVSFFFFFFDDLIFMIISMVFMWLNVNFFDGQINLKSIKAHQKIKAQSILGFIFEFN